MSLTIFNKERGHISGNLATLKNYVPDFTFLLPNCPVLDLVNRINPINSELIVFGGEIVTHDEDIIPY